MAGPNDDALLMRLLLQGIAPGEAERIANDAGNRFAGALDQVNAKLRALHETQSKLMLATDIARIQKQINEEQKKGLLIERLIASETTAARRSSSEQEALAMKLAAAKDRAAKQSAATAIAAAREEAEWSNRLASAKERALAQEAAAYKSMVAAKKEAETGGGAGGGFGALFTAANATIVAAGIAHVASKLKELSHEVVTTTQVYNALSGSIDELRAGTGGEVADIDLITAKSRAQQKELELTGKEWEALGHRAKRFADSQGTSVKEALDNVIDGLANAKEKTLRQAGVYIDATAATEKWAKAHHVLASELDDSTKAMIFREAALAKMIETESEGAEKTGHLGSTANEVEKAFASMTNAWNEFLVALGNSEVLAAVVQTMGNLLAEWYEILKTIIGAKDQKRLETAGAAEDKRISEAAKKRAADRARRLATEDSYAGRAFRALGGKAPEEGADVSFGEEEAGSILGHRRKPTAADKAAAKAARDLAFKAQYGGDFMGEGPAFKEEPSLDLDSLMLGAFGGSANREERDAKIVSELTTEKMRLTEALLAEGKGASLMEQMIFGAAGSDEWLAHMQTVSDATLTIFTSLQDAGSQIAEALAEKYVAAMFGGNEFSLKKALAQIARAKSAEMMVNAIAEGAYAVGSLFSNPPAAAAHGVAAAEFTAASLAIAAIGRQFGTGVESPSTENKAAASAPVTRGQGARADFGGTSGLGGSQTQAKERAPINILVIGSDGGRAVRKALEDDYRSSGIKVYEAA